MEKTLCFVLSIVMLLSLTVTAFAAEPESDTPNPAAFTENDGDYIGETQEGSERITVHDAAWFKKFRASYTDYETHYTYNFMKHTTPIIPDWKDPQWAIFTVSKFARDLLSGLSIWPV